VVLAPHRSGVACAEIALGTLVVVVASVVLFRRNVNDVEGTHTPDSIIHSPSAWPTDEAIAAAFTPNTIPPVDPKFSL
jgi:hypothetical protein